MSANNIAVIGASGGIGAELVRQLSRQTNTFVYAFSRSVTLFEAENVKTGHIDYSDEKSIENAAKLTKHTGALDLVIVATGLLHNQNLAPEKALREISAENLQHNFLVNTIGPALAAKHFIPLLNRTSTSIYAALSARVGSISDNRLGGWYSYRASKSALNMIIKTASIEAARRNKNAIVIGLHPGTVNTHLSAPFQANVPKEKLFTRTTAAKQLIDVISEIKTEDTGKVLAWDGCEISP